MIQEQGMNPIVGLSKQELMLSVVHDLRTPMTVIKGYLQILLSGVMGELSADQMKLIRRSIGPLEDLILLTENLLQSVTLQQKVVPLKLVEIDLDQLLAETVDFYQIPFQQRGMQIYREGNTMGVRVRVDVFWFKRLMHNLIWNAFKFTPDQGQVSLHVEYKDGGL